ncbi:hypothetical protein [Streptomyces nanshensis]|uniref:Toxin HicA n=1 Tax=Streptomyces nanshensis TaxID=518642 RepID=A0A1E7L8Q9_9ACTN|nr:hypothetical protein [Streptomyces nanshensis]OEV12586.1 hypothetical protein AN218_07635 [Streptomyces nanshensis]
MMANREVKDILKKLDRDPRFTHRRTGKGHHQVRLVETSKVVAYLPSTPSDSRTLKNCLADLKRHGFKP